MVPYVWFVHVTQLLPAACAHKILLLLDGGSDLQVFRPAGRATRCIDMAKYSMEEVCARQISPHRCSSKFNKCNSYITIINVTVILLYDWHIM